VDHGWVKTRAMTENGRHAPTVLAAGSACKPSVLHHARSGKSGFRVGRAKLL